jgi:hypothetical protein
MPRLLTLFFDFGSELRATGRPPTSAERNTHTQVPHQGGNPGRSPGQQPRSAAPVSSPGQQPQSAAPVSSPGQQGAPFISVLPAHPAPLAPLPPPLGRLHHAWPRGRAAALQVAAGAAAAHQPRVPPAARRCRVHHAPAGDPTARGRGAGPQGSARKGLAAGTDTQAAAVCVSARGASRDPAWRLPLARPPAAPDPERTGPDTRPPPPAPPGGSAAAQGLLLDAAPHQALWAMAGVSKSSSRSRQVGWHSAGEPVRAPAALRACLGAIRCHGLVPAARTHPTDPAITTTPRPTDRAPTAGGRRGADPDGQEEGPRVGAPPHRLLPRAPQPAGQAVPLAAHGGEAGRGRAGAGAGGPTTGGRAGLAAPAAPRAALSRPRTR